MDKAYELKPGELGDVPLVLIDPDPEQPRKDFDDDYIAELAASIKADGVIQPIVLRTNPEQPGRFLIVAGENRWRGSKQAKIKTIPAVLREVEGLNRLIIQLKENHQRKDLNPMEWALAMQTMHKVHGLKQVDIEKTLKESGVGNFGRAYISNMIRLLELPEWAQTMIRHNALTASHGKHLLPAMKSEKVMEELRTELEADSDISTNELQQTIYWKFSKHHTDLTSYKTAFDYRDKCVATGCQKMRKVSSSHTESTFCLDDACHAILQAEAKKEESAQRQQQQDRSNSGSGESGVREVSFDDDNRVDINQQQLNFHRDYRHIESAGFDVSGCEGCKHRHIAVKGDDTDSAEEDDCCFLVTCYIQKEDEANRARRLLKQYMKGVISQLIGNDASLALRLLAWCSCVPNGIVSSDDDEWIVEGNFPISIDDDYTHQLLFKNGLFSINRFLDADDEPLQQLAAYAVTQLDSGNLVDLWKRFNCTIDDYRINAEFLAEHTAEEIEALFSNADIPAGTFAELVNARNDGCLDQFAIEHNNMAGVPDAMRFVYEQMTMKEEN